jgi:hypothetical protein
MTEDRRKVNLPLLIIGIVLLVVAIGVLAVIIRFATSGLP